jgi:general secretion pathway protein G
MRTKRGFTLVEILIVVVILGILAAIVIPQFTEASSEAKVSSLISNLQTVRSQLQLYKIQHNDNYPAAGMSGLLLGKTNSSGTLNAADAKYGPYLQEFPSNPFIDDPTKAKAVTEGTSTTVPADNSTGWYYDTTAGSGDFRANDSGTTSNGVAHKTL